MRSFDKIGQIDQCDQCGLAKGYCICHYPIEKNNEIEFWLLTHENEMTRTSNTGRLIEKAFFTRIFVWQRTSPPKELLDLIKGGEYDLYLLYDRGESQAIEKSKKKKAFLILDGTWKEVRKIYNKSDYLKKVKILELEGHKTNYDLRRNKDDHHICTAEVAIEVIKQLSMDSEPLGNYFRFFMDRYHAAKFKHKEVTHD